MNIYCPAAWVYLAPHEYQVSVRPSMPLCVACTRALFTECLSLLYLMRVLHPVYCPLWTHCSEPCRLLSAPLSLGLCAALGPGTASVPHGCRGRCGGRGGSVLGHLSSLQGSAAHVASAVGCSEAASPLAPALLTWVGYLTPNPHVPSACLLNYSFFLPPCSPTSGCHCSVTQLCPNLCDPMDCSTPGFPVLHHLPEFAQIHVR